MRFPRHRSTLIAGWLGGLALLLSYAPADPFLVRPGSGFGAPSRTAWFGTDRLGRDLYSRAVYGARRSLFHAGSAQLIAIPAALATATTFTLLFRRKPRVESAVATSLLSLRIVPPFLFALTIGVLLPGSSLALILGLAFLSFIYAQPVFLTALRGALAQPTLEGARALGASPKWVLRHYVVPALGPQLAAYALLDFNSLVAYEALFGFVGLNEPPRPSLGQLIYEARPYLFDHPWLLIAPLFFLITLTAGIWLSRWTATEWR